MGDGFALARTATLLGSVLTSLSSGTNYVFSAYAPQLGTRLHITYTQLNIIGLSGNMGVYTTGVIFGRIVDRRGPRPLMVLSFVFLFAGYMGLRKFYDAGPSNDENLSLWSLIAMSVFSYTTGAGGCAGLSAAINCTAKSFPERLRATTVGFVLSGFGLSAFFFSALARWFFPGNTSSLLLFLSLGTSLPVIIGFFTVRPVPHPERPDSGPGGLLYRERDGRGSRSRLLGTQRVNELMTDERGSNVFVGGPSSVDEDAVIDEESSDAGAPDGYLGILPTTKVAQSRSHSIELSPSESGRGRSVSTSRKPVSRTRSISHQLQEPADKHGIRLLAGWEFWLLFTILSLLSGTGLMFINNVGTVAQALLAKGNPDFDRIHASKLQAAQVSVISLANCGARIGVGVGADFFKSRFAIHRSYLLSVISILLILSQIVGARIENVNNLWLASLILGLGYGGIFGLLPTITIEWFGLVHFSENWGFVSMAPLFGGNIFSILFGRNLDAHVPSAADLNTVANPYPSTSIPRHLHLHPLDSIPGPQGRQCLEGRACYTATLSVTTMACVVALGLSLVAAWRDRWKAGTTRKYESIPQEPEVLWENENEAEE